jgi:hypothetical protein
MNKNKIIRVIGENSLEDNLKHELSIVAVGRVKDHVVDCREQIKFRECLLPFCSGPFLSIILPVVLYGCKTWLLTLREEYTHRFRISEKRMMTVFELRGRNLAGGWRRLYIKGAS